MAQKSPRRKRRGMEVDVHPNWQQRLKAHGFALHEAAGVVTAEPSEHVENPRWIDLSDLGLLTLRGADARTFLQGYATCDINEVTPSQALIGAYCNIQGRVVSDFLLIEQPDALWLVLHRSVIARVMGSLKKYLAFSKSQLADASDQHVIYGLIEPEAALPSTGGHVQRSAGSVIVGIDGVQRRALVVTTPERAAAEIGEQLMFAGRSDVWRRIDIASMIAHVTDATAETFLPQMWGLDERGAISFTKGCYLGQEVIARAQHRGQVKRSLARLAWRGITPAVGLTIRAHPGSASATLVTTLETGPGQGLALAIGNFGGADGTFSADGVTFAAA